MFPNLIYRRNMINQSLISTDNLIPQQNSVSEQPISKKNKNKIDNFPSISKQTESSLFQFNTNVLNHLFLTSNTSSSLTLPTTTTTTNSIYNSFALAVNAASYTPFYNTAPIQQNNNIFAIAARYNSAFQTSQLIAIKNDQLVALQSTPKSTILCSIINGRYVQTEILPFIFNNSSLTNNLNLQKILLKILPVRASLVTFFYIKKKYLFLFLF
jgi:hypothetical protein